MTTVRRGLWVTLRVLIGPWPIHPWAISLIAFYGLFVAAGSRTQTFAETFGEYLHLIWPQWLAIAVASVLIGAILLGASRLPGRLSERCRPESCRKAYIATIALGTVGVSIVIIIALQLSASEEIAGALPPIHVRFMLNIPLVFAVLLVANGVIASVNRRLARQERALAARLRAVRSERSLMLAAEEQVRAEASRTLHDDIQAALLRAVVRLEDLREHLDGGDRERFDAAIDEIEQVREVRVRSLGRVLSPNIADVGLLQALEELGGHYVDVMEVRFDFPTVIQERFHPVGQRDEIALALYRIAEQCLLNALKHGRATVVDLSLEEISRRRVRMTVTANGDPPPGRAIIGTGSATINSWLDAVGGEWGMAPGNDGMGSRVDVIVGGRQDPSARP